jgi:hypothetical protein
MKQVRDSVSEERVDALASLGFTDRQARFLVTVMVYGGAFLERQYCTFAGIAHGQKTHDFLRKLIDRGYVTVITRGRCIAAGSITPSTSPCTKRSASQTIATAGLPRWAGWLSGSWCWTPS